MALRIISIGIAAYICLGTNLCAGGSCFELQERIEEIFAEKSPAVVRVVGFFDTSSDGVSAKVGSGFFIKDDGHIVTTAGAVSGAKEVLIEHGQQSFSAEVIGEDVITNLAVLKVVSGRTKFQSLSLGNESSLPAIGSFLLGVTCELGLDPGPSLGMAIGTNISHGDIYFETTYLRSDLPADGGEPGSPVFDLSGNLVGILMASIPQIHSSFILPARAVRRVVLDILLSGAVRYAHIGLHTRLERSTDGDYRVIVDRIEKNSPAERANLSPGDRIVAIGDMPLQSLGDLRDAIFFAQPESIIPLKIVRGKKVSVISVRTATRVYPLSDSDLSD